MKKLVLMMALVVVAMAAIAQKGVVTTFATTDTINGNETVYFTGPQFTGGDILTIQAACDNIGGTSDGTLSLEASVDGTDWVAFTAATNIMTGMPNDSLTIVDAANVTWIIEVNGYYKYRIKGVGTASDSTLITTKYIRK
jgi:hypothetical protein